MLKYINQHINYYMYHFGGLNEKLFIILNQYLNKHPQIALILKYISSLFFIGNFSIIWITYALYIYFATKTIKISPNNYKVSKEYIYFCNKYNLLVYTGSCYTILGIIYAILKFTINMPRPFCSIDTHLFTSIIDTSSERCLSSFPSAHLAMSVLITYFLWDLTKNFWYKALLIFIIILVALSRISLAMHYPADLFYSMIIALSIIKFTQKLICFFDKLIILPIRDWIFKKIIL